MVSDVYLVRTYANSAQATVMKLRNSACKEIIHSEVTFLTNLLFISKVSHDSHDKQVELQNSFGKVSC